MKTKVWDPETKQWRTDYVVMPSGAIFQTVLRDTSYLSRRREYGPELIRQDDWKLSRFTGLCDIDCVNIWECDVLVDDALNYYHVVFDNGSFYVKRNNEPVRLLSDMVHSLWAYDNSLEHPELLEVNNQRL